MPTLILDDFTGSSLDAAWTRRGVTTADETWNDPGLTTTVSAGEGYFRSLPASGDFVVEMSFTLGGSGGRMPGPMILDDTGYGVSSAWYGNPESWLTLGVSNYQYASTFTQGTTQATPTTSRLRLTRVGDVYTTAYSVDDGATWSAETGELTRSFTPTQVGFGEILTTAVFTIHEFKLSTAGADPVTGTVAATLPTLSVSLSGAVAAPPVTGSLASTLPAPTFTGAGGSSSAVVTATMAATLPALTASLSGAAPAPSGITGVLAVPLPALSASLTGRLDTIDTDLTYSDDGYGYDGIARVVYDPPVVEPVGIQRVKVRRVHQSLPAPTLVNGRPT